MNIEEADRLILTTRMPLREVANRIGSTYGAVRMWYSRSYTPSFRAARKIYNYSQSKLGALNPMTGKFKEEHPNYKGVVGDGKGYLLVLKPEWYTGRKRSKHVFQHHYNYCLAHGLTEIPDGYAVHHIDHDKHNNRVSNLQLMTYSEHSLHHQNVTRTEA